MNRNIFYFLCITTLIFSCKEKETRTSEELFVPDDLEVVLWAESPMLNNPTNMDVDIKGRIWVTEAVNYRGFRNNDSFFLHRAKGDRIMILQDTDNDGKADSAKVFVQDPDLISPVGIAVLGNKVVVSCSPNLIVYTDENGDDVPDKKEILLTGFGGKDHDHSLHAVYGGPDGNWYFNVGNAGPHIVTDRSGWTLRSGSMYTGGSPYNEKNEGGMKSDDGNVWTGGLALRVNADGKNLKVLGHNFRNSYEVVPDSYGNLWQNDNDDEVLSCRVSWLMEGGNAGYFSEDGTRNWKADQRPGQEVPTAHWHQEDPGVMPVGDITGAGAPTGITMIEGDELGTDYRGSLLSADAGRNMIFHYHPQVTSSGYKMNDRKVIVSSLKGLNEDYIWNDSTLKFQKNKWFRPSDVTIGTDGAIYVADWYDPVVGGHLMQDSTGFGRIYRISRKDRKMTNPVIDLNNIEGQIQALKNPAINVRYSGYLKLKEQGDKVIEPVKKLLDDENPYIRARAVWLLPANELEKLLSHKNEMLRATAYRALRQFNNNIIPYAEKMVNDTSAFVRREVAVSLTGLPYESKKSLLLKLTGSCKDRWMLETIGKAVAGHESEFYDDVKNVLAKGKSPLQWSTEMKMFAWRLHPPEAVSDLALRANDKNLDDKERLEALTALGFSKGTTATDEIKKLTTSNKRSIVDAANFWLDFRSPSSLPDSKVSGQTLTSASVPESGKKYIPGDITKLTGNAGKGEKLFITHCSACHKVKGKGSNIGPDLSVITKKYADEQLVEAIIFPSASVAFGYEPWIVETKDKNSVYGFLISDNKTAMIIRDITGRNHTIEKTNISSAKKQDKSIMPSAGQMNLSEQDLADIVGYLKSQVKD
jgi:putative membrane-bound dehydrogenase-like protein